MCEFQPVPLLFEHLALARGRLQSKGWQTARKKERASTYQTKLPYSPTYFVCNIFYTSNKPQASSFGKDLTCQQLEDSLQCKASLLRRLESVATSCRNRDSKPIIHQLACPNFESRGWSRRMRRMNVCSILRSASSDPCRRWLVTCNAADHLQSLRCTLCTANCTGRN